MDDDRGSGDKDGRGDRTPTNPTRARPSRGERAKNDVHAEEHDGDDEEDSAAIAE